MLVDHKTLEKFSKRPERRQYAETKVEGLSVRIEVTLIK